MSLDRVLADCHASSREVEALFLSAGGGPAEGKVVRHLLDGCVACADASAAFWSHRFRLEVLPPDLVAPGDELNRCALDRVFDRLEEKVRRAYAEIDKERAEARRHLSSLLQQPIERQLLLVNNSRRMQTWSTCEALLEESFKLRFQNPQMMAALARVAVEVSGRLPEERYGSARVRDFQARCWLGLGNAQRVLGDFTNAESAIERARWLLGRGTGDPLDRALWLDVRASLWIALRRFSEADRNMGMASRLYYSVGQKHSLGSALIKRSMINESLEKYERAIVLARAGLELIDTERDPSVAVGGWLNVIRALHFAGRSREALTALERARTLYVRQRDRTTLLRFQWMEGVVAQALHREDQAEGCLTEAREGFVKLGITYESALVSLDLAGVLAAQGRYPEVRRLAIETVGLFRGGECRAEVLAAMNLFRRAAESERVTRSLLERVAASIREAQRSV